MLFVWSPNPETRSSRDPEPEHVKARLSVLTRSFVWSFKGLYRALEIAGGGYMISRFKGYIRLYRAL